MESGGATLLVGTWQTSRRKRNGQFTLSTQLINPKFCVLRPHRRSTTVSDLRDSVCVCGGGGGRGGRGVTQVTYHIILRVAFLFKPLQASFCSIRMARFQALFDLFFQFASLSREDKKMQDFEITFFKDKYSATSMECTSKPYQRLKNIKYFQSVFEEGPP